MLFKNGASTACGASLENNMARPYRYYWQGAGASHKQYEPEYLMKLGNLTRKDALALIDEHDGDRNRINAELLDRKRRDVQEAEASANLL